MRFLRVVLLAVPALVLIPLARPQPAAALFHLAVIDEVMSGFNGDPNAQYVEIKMLASSQRFVTNTRLTAFNSDGTLATVLLLVPNDVANDGSGVRWIMGTQAFATASGIAPDFTWDPVVDGSIPPSGMVCWGAPGASAPDPSTWDPAISSNYTDCVSYGDYAGTMTAAPLHPPPTTLGPGDGTLSLQRLQEPTAGGDLADFGLACPTPENNAGAVGTLAPDTDNDGTCNALDNDDDGDGIKDAVDNCPLNPDPDQTDDDSDGAGAPCDKNDAVYDMDGDGCADGEELGPDETLGGQRDPNNPYDFYDVNADLVVDLADILEAIAGFGGSDANLDRAGGDPKGPDGVVDLQDILEGISQFGHSCSAPP